MTKEGLEYKIFMSDSADWYVAAKKGASAKSKPLVFYQGNYREDDCNAILDSMGMTTPVEERVMDSGTHLPQNEDF